MDILWAASDPLSVRSVVDRLNLRGRRRYAYTTVMTTLARLYDKNIVSRTLRGRGFDYAPKENKHAFFRRMSQQILNELSQDFGDMAVAHFVDGIENVSPKQLEKWRKLLKDVS